MRPGLHPERSTLGARLKHLTADRYGVTTLTAMELLFAAHPTGMPAGTQLTAFMESISVIGDGGWGEVYCP